MEDFSNDKPKAQDLSHIKGWGIDADPENDPTYPMRDRSKDDHQGYSWRKPVQQPVGTEVLHSVERPNVTAVYGTAKPPSGVSGMIRRAAFKYSEGTYAHWLLLLVADRVNMVEGIASDLGRGKVPNVLAETGIRAQWRYNRKSLVKKTAVAAALVVGTTILLSRRRK